MSLKKPMLITRDMETGIINGTATATSLGITSDQLAVSQVIHMSSNLTDVDSPMDVNGALIVPMDPVDISGYACSFFRMRLARISLISR